MEKHLECRWKWWLSYPTASSHGESMTMSIEAVLEAFMKTLYVDFSFNLSPICASTAIKGKKTADKVIKRHQQVLQKWSTNMLPWTEHSIVPIYFAKKLLQAKRRREKENNNNKKTTNVQTSVGSGDIVSCLPLCHSAMWKMLQQRPQHYPPTAC